MKWIRQMKSVINYISLHRLRGFVILISSLIFLGLTAKKCKYEELFTPDELKAIDVYKPGDKFKMINTTNDTMVFVITERKLERRTINDYRDHKLKEVEELNGRFEVYNSGIKIGDGFYFTTSYIDYIHCTVDIDSAKYACIYDGDVPVFAGNDTLNINGITYTNVSCDKYGNCFARGVGFIRFIGKGLCNDTLTLVK